MAKATVHHEPNVETPSQKVVKAASELVYVTDAKGRKLGLRPLPFLEEFRIVEAVGPERSMNRAYMGMLNPLLLIAEIDGDRINVPRTHLQIEALIQRAGREGFLAAFEGMNEHFGGDAALDDKIKNVDGTPASETDSGS